MGLDIFFTLFDGELAKNESISQYLNPKAQAQYKTFVMARPNQAIQLGIPGLNGEVTVTSDGVQVNGVTIARPMAGAMPGIYAADNGVHFGLVSGMRAVLHDGQLLGVHSQEVTLQRLIQESLAFSLDSPEAGIQSIKGATEIAPGLFLLDGEVYPFPQGYVTGQDFGLSYDQFSHELRLYRMRMIEGNGRFSIVVPGFGRVEVEATKIGAVILRWKGENGTEQVVSLEIDPTNPTTVSRDLVTPQGEKIGTFELREGYQLFFTPVGAEEMPTPKPIQIDLQLVRTMAEAAETGLYSQVQQTNVKTLLEQMIEKELAKFARAPKTQTHVHQLVQQLFEQDRLLNVVEVIQILQKSTNAREVTDRIRRLQTMVRNNRPMHGERVTPASEKQVLDFMESALSGQIPHGREVAEAVVKAINSKTEAIRRGEGNVDELQAQKYRLIHTLVAGYAAAQSANWIHAEVVPALVDRNRALPSADVIQTARSRMTHYIIDAHKALTDALRQAGADEKLLSASVINADAIQAQVGAIIADALALRQSNEMKALHMKKETLLDQVRRRLTRQDETTQVHEVGLDVDVAWMSKIIRHQGKVEKGEMNAELMLKIVKANPEILANLQKAVLDQMLELLARDKNKVLITSLVVTKGQLSPAAIELLEIVYGLKVYENVDAFESGNADAFGIITIGNREMKKIGNVNALPAGSPVVAREAATGNLLIRRALAEAVEHYFNEENTPETAGLAATGGIPVSAVIELKGSQERLGNELPTDRALSRA
jgi:hypothetical protein